jgi:hypothetical protein
MLKTEFMKSVLSYQSIAEWEQSYGGDASFITSPVPSPLYELVHSIASTAAGHAPSTWKKWPTLFLRFCLHFPMPLHCLMQSKKSCVRGRSRAPRSIALCLIYLRNFGLSTTALFNGFAAAVAALGQLRQGRDRRHCEHYVY